VVYTGGSANAFAVSAGFFLNPGDRVDTRGGGRVAIELSDGSMVVVEPESVIVLKDFRQAESLRELFEIVLGKVRVKINHVGGRPNPYRMNSPTASIAVRGTEFTISVQPDGDTEVLVIEGAVQVTSLSDPGQSILVEAGRGVLVQAGRDLRLVAAAAPNAAAKPAGDRDANGSDDSRAVASAGNHGSDDHEDSPKSSGNSPKAMASVTNRESDDREEHKWQGSGSGAPAQSGTDSHSGSDSHTVAAVGNVSDRSDDKNEKEEEDDDDKKSKTSHNPPSSSGGGATTHPDRPANTPRATSGVYDSYVAGLSDIAQIPFLFRFNAFPEAHLDSLENPAYATQFGTAEARLFLLPTFGTRPDDPSGTLPSTYGVSPRVSVFGRLGNSNYYAGGSVSGLHAGDNGGLSTANLYSGSVAAARRFGRNSFGVELESLRGSGASSTTATYVGETTSVEAIRAEARITQTRLTAGLSHEFGTSARLGVFYRYGFLSANDHDVTHTLNSAALSPNLTESTGHSSEIGFRLRGVIHPRLFYGLTGAWLGASLADRTVRTGVADSHERDFAHRASFGWGLGYAVSRRTVVTLDLAGGLSRASSTRIEDANGHLLQSGLANSRFVSSHAAVQTDLTRRLFVSGSYMYVWHSGELTTSLFPDRFGVAALAQDSVLPISPSAFLLGARFSDFGAGWRFTPSLFVQYLFTTDYGASASSHALMLRYTVAFRKDR
jgi:hypothetical protein